MSFEPIAELGGLDRSASASIGPHEDAVGGLRDFNSLETKTGNKAHCRIEIVEIRAEEDGFESESRAHGSVYRPGAAQEEIVDTANRTGMQTRLILAVVAGVAVVGGGIRFAVEGARTASSLRQIRGVDAGTRTAAVRALMDRGVLFDALQGGAPPTIRLAAIATLKAMASSGAEPKAFDELVLMLKDPDTEATDSRTHPVRDAARTAISEVGGRYPARIVDAAKHPDTNIRTHVREAMKKLVVPLRTEMASRLGDKDLRQPMGELLAMAGNESVPLILPWLSPEKLKTNGDADVTPAKVALVEALGRFKSPVAARAILSFLDDPDPNVRRTAVAALSNIADLGTAPRLIAAARSSATDGPARASAATALGAIATDTTAAALADLLRDSDTFVASSAAAAMRRAGAVAAPWIRIALTDPDPSVRRRA
ncbi:MAG: HEAT repeat domain-containing protein, partial [Armatimonadota bacterium]